MNILAYFIFLNIFLLFHVKKCETDIETNHHDVHFPHTVISEVVEKTKTEHFPQSRNLDTHQHVVCHLKTLFTGHSQIFADSLSC